eukprot:111070-Amphidinium_carterae.1
MTLHFLSHHKLRHRPCTKAHSTLNCVKNRTCNPRRVASHSKGDKILPQARLVMAMTRRPLVVRKREFMQRTMRATLVKRKIRTSITSQKPTYKY